jgi:hypothetical protein
MAEPPDPKDVPVHDDSDDELHAEDYWIEQGDKVIRMHRRPRTKAFDPVMTHDVATQRADETLFSLSLKRS